MRLIIYVLLLGAAVYCGVLLKQVPDILMLSTQDWVVEMPMWLGISFVVFIIFFTFVFSRILYGVFSGFHSSKAYFTDSKKRKAQKFTTQALVQLAQSNWRVAEKKAIKAAYLNDTPFGNYVSAAKAAHQQNAWDRRDKYLELAAKSVKDGELSAGIIKAKLQYEQGALEQSLETLQDLIKIAPKHPLVLRLQGELYASAKNWSGLLQVLPQLKKYKGCSKYMIYDLEEDAYRGLLLEQMNSPNKQDLVQFWHDIPKEIRSSLPVIEMYVSCLYKSDAYEEAMDVIKHTLKKKWDKKLVKIFGFIETEELGKQIAIAEGWLKHHPGDSDLLLTLAKLCLKHQLWGKAKNYLEMSIQISPQPEAYIELGRLFDHLGEFQKCRDCYKQGLLSIVDDVDFK